MSWFEKSRGQYPSETDIFADLSQLLCGQAYLNHGDQGRTMKLSIQLAIWVLCMGGCAMTAHADGVTWTKLYNESDAREEAVLKQLQSALDTKSQVARLYYQGVCIVTNSHANIWFPKIGVRKPVGRGMAAVHTVFADNRRTTVVDDDGIIRIVIGNIPNTILNTKINHLTLTPEDQYNEIMAIYAIQSAPEVLAVMKTSGIMTPLRTLSFPMIKPAPGYPHLPEHLSNLTVDEALDDIVKTFGGVVLFGMCDRVFYIDYSPADRFE